jgi:spore germination protein YaaH
MNKWLAKLNRIQRNRWVTLFLITFIISFLITMLLAFGYGIYQMANHIPNKQRVTASYAELETPVFFRGQVYPISADGQSKESMLPHQLVYDWIDSDLWVEHDAEQGSSITITTEDQVVHLKNNEMTALLNDVPFSLQRPMKQMGERIYIPIETLLDIYPITVLHAEKSNAILLFKQGDIIQWGRSLASEIQPIRTGNSITFPISSDLFPEERVMILAEENSWYKIQQITSGHVGYISKSKIALELPELISIPRESQIQSFTPWKPKNQKINLTWENVYRKNPDTSKIPELSGLNVISPTWFSLADKQGNVNSLADTSYVKWAKGRGYQVWALLNNQFDPDLTQHVLSNYTSRMNMIKQILAYANTYQLDGINVDFENMYLTDKASFVQLMREMRPLLHNQGLVLSVDVTFKSSNERWSMPYDRPALIQTVDYMMIMAYDEHWASSPKAGSVASLPWVDQSIQRLLNEDKLPAHKLLLGVPFYTRIWTEEEINGQMKVSSKSASMNEIDQIIKQKSLTPVYLTEAGQHYIEYREDGKRKRVWIEDEVSMQSRIDLIHKYQLSGIASWRRGFEKTEIWKTINDALQE